MGALRWWSYGADSRMSGVGSIGIVPITRLGIDPRDLSAYDRFLEVNKRILHHRQVAFVLPTPP